MEKPRSIIVKMPNWVGDLVMATPILADLHNKWPDVPITAMCLSSLAPLLQYDPNIEEIYSYKRPNRWIPHQEHWAIIEKIRQGEYDLGLLLTNSFSSAWWFRLGKVKQRVGFSKNMRRWLLTKALPFPKNIQKQHLVLTYKSLLASLGIPVSNTDPCLYLSEEERTAAEALLHGCGITIGKNIVVGINPGAAYGSAKCWLPERFREVTKSLLENPNVYVIYFGDPNGAPLVHEICKDMPERVIDLAGKTTLRELMALINCCSVFLSNDSGPMHMAAALKVPVLALFGSTSEIKTGPYGIGKVIHKHVDCSPCYKRTCPIDFRCMTRIGVDEVYQQLKEMIDENRN